MINNIFINKGEWESFTKEIAEVLLDHGADVNAGDSITPLIAAARAGHAGMVSLLLDRGADIEARGEAGQTALMQAVRAGQMDIAVLLVERGADAGAKEGKGHAVMGCAVEAFLNCSLNAGGVRKLISAGCPVSNADAEALIAGLEAGRPKQAAIQRSGKNTLYKALLAAAAEQTL